MPFPDKLNFLNNYIVCVLTSIVGDNYLLIITLFDVRKSN